MNKNHSEYTNSKRIVAKGTQMIFELIFLITVLSEFVQKTCSGRDDSHGHAHMQKVADIAMRLFQTETGHRDDAHALLKYVLVIAWLHDVADTKYDYDGNLKKTVHNFLLETLFPGDLGTVNKIMQVIDCISFSTEDKRRKAGDCPDWITELGGDWALVRNCVSDADKLEALGETGFARVVEYTRHHSTGDLKAEVEKHAVEKLYRLLGENFIVTSAGREMAVEKEGELRVLIAKNVIKTDYMVFYKKIMQYQT